MTFMRENQKQILVWEGLAKVLLGNVSKPQVKFSQTLDTVCLGYMLKSYFLFALCMKSTGFVPLSKK